MKKLFFSLIIWLFWFINFSIAWSYTFTGVGGIPDLVIPQNWYSCNMTLHCNFSSSSISYIKFRFMYVYSQNWHYKWLYSSDTSSLYTVSPWNDLVYDFNFATDFTPWYSTCEWIPFFYMQQCQDCDSLVWSCTFSGATVLSSSSSSSCPECETCPTTWEILSWYILESSIDSQYCVENELCPISTWSVTTWDSNWSALFINWIQHASAPLINVTIPDNIYWDYDSSEEEFVLDIGSGYDQDYIDWVIDVQSYRPTSEDFTQTFVGGLILFTPYVVVLLFVILVRRLIWRIFKTK